jgi:uncharacterized protein
VKRYLKYISYLAAMIGVSSVLAGPREDLFKAVEIDAPQMIRSLIAADIDPNQRDDRGDVALYIALRNESWQAAEALLAHPKIDVDIANANGETPVMMAALRGQTAWVVRLIERGAQINRAGWSPLHYAASGGAPDAVKLLLDRGAAINARSPNGTTPLMMAARYGAIDSADLLRERGADLALRNDLGMRAVDFATGAGRAELGRRLLPP